MNDGQIDQRLRDYGRRWREEQPRPVARVTDLGRQRERRPGASLLAVASAVLVAVIVGAVWWTRVPQRPVPATSSTPTAPPSSVVPSTPITTTPSTPSTGSEAVPACTASQLAASIGPDAAAAGTQHVLVLLQNTSGNACNLGGIPTLYGIDADGSATRLTFIRTSDPAQDVATVTTGSGTLAPTERGGFALTEGLNGCPATPEYTTLRIRLRAGQDVELPWSSTLSLGCPEDVGPAGVFPPGPLPFS